MTWGVRWITSTLAPRYAVAARSVSLVFVMGRAAVGTTMVKGGLEYNFVNGADSNNPFNTYSTLTYKISGAAACLNPSAGRILAVHEKVN